MKRAFVMLGVVVLAQIAAASGALADVVGPPPASCPAGSKPATCHGGPHCDPIVCTTNADCAGGDVCKDTPFCTSMISCAGQIPPDADPNMYNQEVVESACAGTCKSGDPCKTLKVCVSEGGSSSSSSSSGSASGGGSPPGSSGDTGSCALTSIGAPFEGGLYAAAVAAVIAGASLARRSRRSKP